MLTQIINGHMFAPRGWLNEGSVLIRDREILEVTNCDLALIGVRLIDVKGMYIVPGFVCMHAHGGSGHSLSECAKKAFRSTMQAHLRHGTTSFYPAISSSPFSKFHQAAHVCERLMEGPNSPILGLHIEGPYLSGKMAGKQLTGQVRGIDEQEYRELVENTHYIRRWDTSPELLGVLELTDYLHEEGILAAMSHTEAEYDDICAVYKTGFIHATHFYNAMPGFHKHREYKCEGTVESVYLTDGITTELIADGIHLPSTILRLAYKLKDVEHACLVTGALSYAATEGRETSNPRYIIEDGIYRLADHPSLAGSIATMDVLVRTMAQAGIPLGDVLRVTSEAPACITGVYNRRGSLQKDKDTGILVVDKELNICTVWRAGKLVQESFLNYK